MNIAQMMRQMQDMQAKMTQMQEKMGEIQADGQAGGEMVKATINGKGELCRVTIDQKLIDPQDKEMLEDLIVAAVNDAKKKIDQEIAKETEKMMGGLNLPPGMKLPF